MEADSAITDDGELIHLALSAEAEPVTFHEAIKDNTWCEAMKEELRAIERNKTWELVPLPQGKVPIAVKWVFRINLKPNGSIAKHKARLVAKGFMQREGFDYSEVFAPVARFETVRLIVSLASWHGWKLWQLDVKSAFLNGPLEEEVYVSQPPGFEVADSDGKALRLRKALYGLKQAPRAWNKRIDSFLTQTGFRKCTVEHGVYIKVISNSDVLLLCLYVDDLVITGSNETEIEKLKLNLKSEFEMSDLGELAYFLGIEFLQTKKGVVMHQKKYVSEILKRFNMIDCNPVTVPVEGNLKLEFSENEASVDATLFRQLVGCLRFICHSRPEISYGVGLVSRFLAQPKQSHLAAARREG